MNSIWSAFLKRDVFLGIGVALCVSATVNTPLLHALITTNELSQPTIVRESSDEEFYLARIQEVANGYPFIGQPYAYEHRNARWGFGFLMEAATGQTVQLSGLSLKHTMILFDFILPFALALMVWLLSAHILPQWYWRIALVIFIFLGTHVELWKRPISPQATSLLFLPYIFLAIHPSRQSVNLALIRAILTGVMAYSYTYHLMFALAMEGLLLLEYIWTQKKQINIKRIVATVAPIGIIGLPWLWQQLTPKDNAVKDALTRLGLLKTHWPNGIMWHIYTMLSAIPLGIISWYNKNARSGSIALLLLLLAGIIALDQSVIIGKELEFSSHYGRIIRMNIVIVVLFCIYTLFKQRQRLCMIIAGLIIIVGIAKTIQPQQMAWQYFANAKETQTEPALVAQQIATTIPPESIVAAPATLGREIVIYTSHYLLFADNMHLHAMSNAELAERAQLWRTIFPEETVQERWIAGSAIRNSTLRRKQECMVKRWLRLNMDNCDTHANADIEQHWMKFQEQDPMSESKLVAGLTQYNVTHLLTAQLLPALENMTQKIATMEPYTLYKFILPETQTDASSNNST